MKAIMACDLHGGIGKSGKLPWNSLRGDLQRFKNLTQNQTVVMGYKTWISLPIKPLPNRRNIVVSRSIKSIHNADLINTLDHFSLNDNHWFIGGAELLNYAWPYIQEFHLTQANSIFECDTYIDLEFLKQNFVVSHTQESIDNTYQIWIKK